jgi:hypothetical protein
MLNLCGIVVAILKMATGRNFSMSGHHLSTHISNFDDIGQCCICAVLWHFQNGHHNTAQIQHCPISSKFDMWVDK